MDTVAQEKEEFHGRSDESLFDLVGEEDKERV